MKHKNNYLQLSSRLYYQKDTDGFSNFVLPHPLSICYKVTDKCNYSCPHCIAAASINNEVGPSTKQVKKTLKIFKDSGIFRVDITGGEPYIRKDMDEILEYGVKLGLDIVITTNGSLLTKKNISVLARHKIFTQISLDGPKEINDKLRGRGSFDRAVKAINALKKKKVPLRINCTVQKANYKKLDSFVGIASDLGVRNLYFIIVSAQGRARNNVKKFCLSEQQEREVAKKIAGYERKGKFNIKKLDYKTYSFSCIVIEPNGDFVSQAWNKDNGILAGNIYKKELNKIWRESGAFRHLTHLLQYLKFPL